MPTASPKPKRHATQQSLNSAVTSICDVMRRSNCAGAMKYVPELTWILFLRILDERDAREAEEAAALGLPFTPSLQPPFRWRDWADKDSAMRQDKNASVWKFVHDKLLPHLKELEKQPGANARHNSATRRRHSRRGGHSDDEVIPAREGAAVTSAADFSPSNGGDPNDTQ